MGGGHWVLRYCGKINFWFCGILWTSAMQFFSIVDGIKDHPPNPSPFLSFFQFPFVSETDWKWKALDLTFMNKFLIVISMLFALNVTYRAVVSTWHQVSTRYWSIMVSGEFRCNIAVCVIFFLFFAVLWCLDPLPPLQCPPPMAAMQPPFSVLLTLLFSTYVSFAWNEDRETGKTSFWAAKLTYTKK